MTGIRKRFVFYTTNAHKHISYANISTFSSARKNNGKLT